MSINGTVLGKPERGSSCPRAMAELASKASVPVDYRKIGLTIHRHVTDGKSSDFRNLPLVKLVQEENSGYKIESHSC